MTKNNPVSKYKVLQALNEWAQQKHYMMKPITSSTNNELHMLTLEIVFVLERLNRIAFIIEVTRFETGEWNLTSFKEMFESAHCRFNYIQHILKDLQNVK